MKLTIAIPTYNRASRLEKALSDLLNEINHSSNKDDIDVYVSNNGSFDNSSEIIKLARHYFSKSCIAFDSRDAKNNEGFDANIIACYVGSTSEYVWFLADDDNIVEGSIDLIFKDIEHFRPSLIYYNCDQPPFNKNNPYIKELSFFDQVTHENIDSLSMIINWPKLSSLVIQKCLAGLEVCDEKTGYAHVSLALICGIRNGKILHSPTFLFYPDSDYLDNIDFVPYISNNVNNCISWALKKTDTEALWGLLKVPYCDPLASSLNVLGAYYRGKHVLTLPLKSQLWATCRQEFRYGWTRRLRDWAALKEIFKFPISLLYAFCHIILYGRKVGRIRLVPQPHKPIVTKD